MKSRGLGFASRWVLENMLVRQIVKLLSLLTKWPIHLHGRWAGMRDDTQGKSIK